MATAQEIVRFALKKSQIIGEGETPSAETLTDGLADLNDMISTWNVERWMITHLLDLGFPADGRIVPYTVGPGGNYAVARRPEKIAKAYLRLFTTGSALPVDVDMEVWLSREQYSLNTLKRDFVSYPDGVWLEATWPMGNLYVYPWPSAGQGYEVHILVPSVMPVLIAASSLDTFPTHYIPAMKFCLARRMRQGYGKGMKPDPELNSLARTSLAAVKNSNFAVPDLDSNPAGLGAGGVYNIYSDGHS